MTTTRKIEDECENDDEDDIGTKFTLILLKLGGIRCDPDFPIFPYHKVEHVELGSHLRYCVL